MIADRTCKFVDFILQFENSIPSIDYKKFSVSLAIGIKAVPKPTEAILHLTVPGRIILPFHFVHVTQSIKFKVDAKRHWLLNIWMLELQIDN